MEEKSQLEEFSGKQFSAISHWQMKYTGSFMRNIAVFYIVFASISILVALYLLYALLWVLPPSQLELMRAFGLYFPILLLPVIIIALSIFSIYLSKSLMGLNKSMISYLKDMNDASQEIFAEKLWSFFRLHSLQVISIIASGLAWYIYVRMVFDAPDIRF